MVKKFISVVSIEGTETVNEDEKVQFKGNVDFHPQLKHVKWQKCHESQYIDINIHEHKYKGSTNDWENPRLEISHVDAVDGVEYRLEVETKVFTAHSNSITLKVKAGKFLFTIRNDK